VAVPRETTPSTAFLRTQVPKRHPSAVVLGEERMGAAVAVSPHHVLTAHYLVMGASDVQLAGADGRPRPVKRFRLDHETGLALLTLDGPPLRPARLRADSEVAPGEPIFLLTCTSKGERKGATGHVCIVGPFEAFWEYMLDRAIMTTAINPGLAGAPLFDSDGRLVGIVSLSLSAVGRYSLAIPVALYVSRREYLEGDDERPDGTTRAWTGIYPQAYDGGVVLTGVVPGGPGDKAGLARGDLILSVDGQTVGSLRELYLALWKRAPGDSISLQVLREGAIRVIEVTAGDRDAFYR
jgi:S1-C subfamily serine protease